MAVESGLPDTPADGPVLDTPANFWKVADAYLSNDERSDAAPREALRAAAASIGGYEASAVYVAKATQAGYRNQVWQGQAISRAHDVMILVDKSGNKQGIAEAAIARLNPLLENGFGAIVVCERAGSDWKICSVIEYDHVNFAEELGKALPGILVQRLPDPASAAVQRAEVPIVDTEAGTSPMIEQHLREAKNVILAGPPGTSKTHTALQLVQALIPDGGTAASLEEVLRGRNWHEVPLPELQHPDLVWELVQMHPSYTYEDFVRGIRTDPGSKGFNLISVDGVLPIISHVASARGAKPTLLIIDEINRCNLPAVLGETIFAIDPAQRGRPIRLQYDGGSHSGDTMRVPSDLLIVATMNTADRSIASLDFALRRRFRFVFLGPSESALNEYYKGCPSRASSAALLMKLINDKIPETDFQVGHSYLMVGKNLDEATWAGELGNKLAYEICPLLKEYEAEGLMSGSSAIEIAGVQMDLLSEQASQIAEKVRSALLGEAS